MQLGDIVQLKNPHKPTLGTDHCQLIFYRLNSHLRSGDLINAWNNWPGFTHGIVVEIISTERGKPCNVSLHLYSPSLGLLYMDNPEQHAIPTYVDFHVSELELYKSAQETGYQPFVELEPDIEEFSVPIPGAPDYEG